MAIDEEALKQIEEATLVVAIVDGGPRVLKDVRHKRRSWVSWDYLDLRLKEEKAFAAVEEMNARECYGSGDADER